MIVGRGRNTIAKQQQLKSSLVPDGDGRYLTPAVTITTDSVGRRHQPTRLFTRTATTKNRSRCSTAPRDHMSHNNEPLGREGQEPGKTSVNDASKQLTQCGRRTEGQTKQTNITINPPGNTQQTRIPMERGEGRWSRRQRRRTRGTRGQWGKERKEEGCNMTLSFFFPGEGDGGALVAFSRKSRVQQLASIKWYQHTVDILKLLSKWYLSKVNIFYSDLKWYQQGDYHMPIWMILTHL